MRKEWVTLHSGKDIYHYHLYSVGLALRGTCWHHWVTAGLTFPSLTNFTISTHFQFLVLHVLYCVSGPHVWGVLVCILGTQHDMCSKSSLSKSSSTNPFQCWLFTVKGLKGWRQKCPLLFSGHAGDKGPYPKPCYSLWVKWFCVLWTAFLGVLGEVLFVLSYLKLEVALPYMTSAIVLLQMSRRRGFPQVSFSPLVIITLQYIGIMCKVTFIVTGLQRIITKSAAF